MRIKRFNEYDLEETLAYEFLNAFDKMVIESEETNYKKVEKRVISDLKLNAQFIATFGAGIGALYPIVQSLITNTKLSVSITPEMIILLTISAFTIAYLEEKKFRSAKEESDLIKDSKSMLEELKMMGVGNGIVKKLINGLKSIKNIFFILAREIGFAVRGLADMFAYTSLLIPIMNGLAYITTKHSLNLDTLPQNFIGLAMGIGTLIAKNAIIEIVKRLKDKFKIDKKKIIDKIETQEPVVQKFNTFTDKNGDEIDLIKEEQ